MYENIKELFNLTRRERNGTVILIILIVSSIIINYNLPQIIEPTFNFGTASSLLVNSQSSNDSLLPDEEDVEFTSLLLDPKKMKERRLFSFNPNTLDQVGYQKLGLTDKQIKPIFKYRERGGIFKQKSDFSKMYVISKQEYQLLEPYIQLPENCLAERLGEQSHQTQSSVYELTPKRKSWKIELNAADTTELKGIRGFGSFTSKKIILYRENLGGFLSVDQLLEVWPIKPELLDSVREFILLDTSLVEKININAVQIERLKKHPYLTTPQAKSLIAYRNKHGPFLQIGDIKKSVLIDEVTFGRLKPYLTI